MTITTLKDLKNLIKACQELGVEAIEIDGIKMNLRPIAVVSNPIKRHMADMGSLTQTDDIRVPMPNIPKPWEMPQSQIPDLIATEELTEEQMLFMSSDPSVMEPKQ